MYPPVISLVLDCQSICISDVMKRTCGLEAEWSFESHFQKCNKNCKILAFDHTVDKKFWLKRFLRNFRIFFNF